MAYLHEMKRLCQRCHTRQAVVELFTQRNDLIGVYCRECGNHELARQKEFEAQRARELRP